MRLSERINIQKRAPSESENGFDVDGWESYYNCWSAFNSVSGREYYSAKATQSEQVVTFTVRHCKKVKVLLEKDASKNFRVVLGSHTYDIEHVSDTENLHQWLEIKAKQVS